MKPDVFPADTMWTDRAPPLSGYGRRLLAEGDSWFTIGTLKLAKASNLLFEQKFGTSTAIVNCAYPGDTLHHVVDSVNDSRFDRLLRVPNFASYWEAVLVSAGGNDLIDAAQLPATRNGRPAGFDERLLLTPAEADRIHPNRTGAARYVSEPGWDLLAGYLRQNFRALVSRRDGGPSASRPLVLHTYHVPVVRPSGTVGAGEGWLYPTLRDYGIPADQRQAVAEELFQRLRALLLSLDCDRGGPEALPQVHVFDSASVVTLLPSDPAATGDSGEWINEIHPNKKGYERIGTVMGPWIDAVLARYPG